MLVDIQDPDLKKLNTSNAGELRHHRQFLKCAPPQESGSRILLRLKGLTTTSPRNKLRVTHVGWLWNTWRWVRMALAASERPCPVRLDMMQAPRAVSRRKSAICSSHSSTAFKSVPAGSKSACITRYRQPLAGLHPKGLTAVLHSAHAKGLEQLRYCCAAYARCAAETCMQGMTERVFDYRLWGGGGGAGCPGRISAAWQGPRL